MRAPLFDTADIIPPTGVEDLPEDGFFDFDAGGVISRHILQKQYKLNLFRLHLFFICMDGCCAQRSQI